MRKNPLKDWPVVDYRNLRPKTLNSDSYKHVKLLLFWPLYCVLFLFLERAYPALQYIVVHSPVDDLIPFCEWFLIPYLFWYIYLIDMHLFTLRYDVPAFKKMMKFIMITYLLTLVIYLLWPTCQNLRPVVMPRENPLTFLVSQVIYRVDTNTNVCPSIHVIGSLAVLFTAFHSEAFGKTGRRPLWTVLAILICLSTLFMKQHSFVDVIVALPVCAVGYYFSFAKRRQKA